MDNAPWWMNLIAWPILWLMNVTEFFTYPKIKCPKCKKMTSINTEKFCKRCLDNY